MIVKNEAAHLAQCLSKVQPYVDEIVVVDTGSTDDTVAIAQQYGARLSYFEWCDDFAAARNFSIAQATGDWVLTLDADEELVVEQPNWRDQLLTQESLAYLVPWIDLNQGITPIYVPRLFRNLPELRYVEPYHERLTYLGNAPQQNITQHQTCFKILHHGYAPARVLEKNVQRDIPMLERIRQEQGLSLLLLMTLADNYLRIERVEQAKECWAEAFERILPHLLSGEAPPDTLRIPALLLVLGLDLLLDQHDYETALLVCRRGLEWFPAYPPLICLTGMVLRELGLPLGAIAYFEQCLQMGRESSYSLAESFDQRYMTVFPSHQLGLALLDLNRKPEAIAALQQALATDPHYPPALETLAALT